MAQIDLILSQVSSQEVRLNIVGEALPSGALSERVTVDRAEINQISEQVSRELLDWANRPSGLRPGPPVRESLERTGLALYQALFGNAGDVLRDLKRRWTTEERYCVVHLDEELVHLPIELCHDGDAFLCETFLIGRRVSAAEAQSRIAPRPTARPRLLVLANPSEDPCLGDSAEEELREIRKSVRGASGIDLRVQMGRAAAGRALDEMLPGSSIVHFIGHADRDPEHPEHSGWRLFGRRWYGADRILRLQNPPAVVFANACASARTADWTSSTPMVRAFLERGTQAYIGTWWEVTTPAAAVFASAFYHSLSQGESVGVALARAREQVIHGFGPDEVTWASYVLYGDPQSRLTLPGRSATRTASTARMLILAAILMAMGTLLPSTLSRIGDDAGVGIEQPAPARGYLTFESEPQGATVWVDGEERGTTPLTLELDEGPHEIALRHPDHQIWEASAVVDPESPQVIRVRMEEDRQ
jgi:hypothetical protein